MPAGRDEEKKNAAVLLSASVERCFVSRMRNFLGTYLTVLVIFTFCNIAIARIWRKKCF